MLAKPKGPKLPPDTTFDEYGNSTEGPKKALQGSLAGKTAIFSKPDRHLLNDHVTLLIKPRYLFTACHDLDLGC